MERLLRDEERLSGERVYGSKPAGEGLYGKVVNKTELSEDLTAWEQEKYIRVFIFP